MLYCCGMTNQQLYFAILVPVFTTILAMSFNMFVIVWQARGIEKRIDGLEKHMDHRFEGIDKRLDRLESRLTTVEQDYKVFFREITQIKSKVGL